MPSRQSVIRALEDAMRHGSTTARIEMLRRVTDLFVDGAERYNEEQVDLFDDVVGRLAEDIETRIRAELAERLAPIENAPPRVIGDLARDASIEVAGPVLRRSERLSDSELLEIAETGSQGHLLAISARRSLSERVTDVLVERGDRGVTHGVAVNRGARLSAEGFSRLVDRAAGDEVLTEHVGLRPDIPPHLFRRLLGQATDIARRRIMVGSSPEIRSMIEHLLVKVSREVGAASELVPDAYEAAQRAVHLLRATGKLNRDLLVKFARERRFEETTLTLAELTGVPAETVDDLMRGDNVDPLLVLCRAKNYDWPTVRALILIRRSCRNLTAKEVEEMCADYQRLSADTALRVLRFWQVRASGAPRPEAGPGGEAPAPEQSFARLMA